MTTSLAAAPSASGSELVGQQLPRVSWVPPHVGSAGEEAVALAAMAGLHLDPWEAWFLTNALNERADGKWAARHVGLVVPRQNGKGPEGLTNRVLTTDGWTTFADIEVGQSVYGADGTPTRVVARSDVMLGERCYEVAFTDGSTYVVGAGHLWRVKHKASPGWTVRSTEDLAHSVGSRRPDNGRMEYNWRVRCDAVPQTPDADLPIDPYVFGLWLGDGRSDHAQLTVGDEDRAYMVAQLTLAGYVVTRQTRGNDEWQPWHIAFRMGQRRSADGFLPRVRALGAWGDKHIPGVYLTASPAQRLALLRGLMDTDGSIATTNRSPQVEFSSSCERLARDFHRLARSLGIRVTPKVRGTTHKDNWRFLWTPTFNPFRMPRKADRFREPTSRRHELMSVTGIREVASVPVRCITVDRPDGVYLTGHLFTPTHNSILEARELAGLFLLGEERITHSAHLWKTASEHFRRIQGLIFDSPELRKQVKRVNRSHGEEGIELHSGQRLSFATRTSGSGRGLTGDTVVIDEAMEVNEQAIDALYPTMTTIPNPQIWFTGSAVDREIHEHGVVFARVRERGLRGDDERLLYAEWSVDEEEFHRNPDMVDDPQVWAQTNPGLGIRIDPEYVRSERDVLSARGFARERLSVGDWPATDAEAQVIPRERWDACADRESVPEDPVVFAFDVSRDRARTAIAVAGRRADRVDHVEVVKAARSGPWVLPTLKELLAKHRRATIVCDAMGPAAALLAKLEDSHLLVEPQTSAEHAAACGVLYDAVDQGAVRHLNDPVLNAAVAGAVKRPMGEKWAWSRKDSSVDITPLVAATLALGALQRRRRGSELVTMDEMEPDAPFDSEELPPLSQDDL